MTKPKTGDYKGVSYINSRRLSKPWQAQKTCRGVSKRSYHNTEREAAVAYDKFCLSFGLKPVNILKRKID